MVYKRYSVTVKMNSLCDMYLLYLGKGNIYWEVKEFQKQECQLRNFYAVMSWLKETIELSNPT